MSSIFINGSQYAISAALDSPLAVSAITNTNPAVATTTVAPIDGSVAVIESVWTALNETVARTANSTATDFDLEGVDTTNTSKYPAGEGAGSVQVVSSWDSLSQIRGVEMAGGDQQFFQYQYVEDASGRQRQKPTFKNAISYTFTMDYDPSLSWYQTLIDLDEAREAAVLRQTLPNGAVILSYGHVGFNKVPTATINENIVVMATLSLLADPIRYAP